MVPIVTVQVCRKGSVLDTLIRSCADDCVSVRSEWQRVAAGSNECAVGEHNSLALRKP